jgi:hypothetical protein
MNGLIVCLEILHWGVSAGGEHLTGTLKWYNDGDLKVVRVKHPLSSSEVRYLNKKESCSSLCRYKVGESSDRFETEAELIKAARKMWKTEFPKAMVLIKGSLSVAEPQQVLSADREFKTTVNRLWKKIKSVGGWDLAACDRICRDYDVFLKEWAKKEIAKCSRGH